MKKYTDNRVMENVKSGDTAQLGLLYERYQKKLFGFFYRMSGQAALSEDLVQSVFLRILRYKHTFKGDGNFAQWMYHLARNVYADQYRKKNPLHFKEGLSVVDEQEDPIPNAANNMEKDEEIRILENALACLDEDKREVIILSRYQKMKYREIATLTDSTEGAVKVKMFRALKELKEIYHKLEKGMPNG